MGKSRTHWNHSARLSKRPSGTQKEILSILGQLNNEHGLQDIHPCLSREYIGQKPDAVRYTAEGAAAERQAVKCGGEGEVMGGTRERLTLERVGDTCYEFTVAPWSATCHYAGCDRYGEWATFHYREQGTPSATCTIKFHCSSHIDEDEKRGAATVSIESNWHPKEMGKSTQTSRG